MKKSSVTNILAIIACGIGSFVGITFYTFALAVAIAGTHLLDALRARNKFAFVGSDRAASLSSASVVLFPGTSFFALDILYLFFFSLIAVVPLALAFIFGTAAAMDAFREKDWQTLKRILAVLIFSPFPIAILFHVFGNIHYQLYCWFKVITSRNACSIMYNGYTFLVGPAGLLAVALPCLLCVPGMLLAQHHIAAANMRSDENV